MAHSYAKDNTREIWTMMILKDSMYLQIFMDIAVLVDAQGDMLDNIESQVF